MFSIETFYLWHIHYILCHSYATFYTKFVYILCKFYPVRSFDYSWNNNLIRILSSQ